MQRCPTHVDSSLWELEPVPDRPGWEKASCSVCGTFIGYNPIRSKKARQNTDVETTGGETDEKLHGLFGEK